MRGILARFSKNNQSPNCTVRLVRFGSDMSKKVELQSTLTYNPTVYLRVRSEQKHGVTRLHRWRQGRAGYIAPMKLQKLVGAICERACGAESLHVRVWERKKTDAEVEAVLLL